MGAFIGLGVATGLWAAYPTTSKKPDALIEGQPFRALEQKQNTYKVPDPVTEKKPEAVTPMAIGGYSESTIPASEYSWVYQEQRKYLKDKEELEKAIKDCAEPSSKSPCLPQIKFFSSMIDGVAKISNPSIQTEIINAYINLIRYDHKEAKTSKSDMDHRSLVASLVDNKGVCDESARLKLFAHEKIGRKGNDLRWLGLDMYNAREMINAHAVAVVRISGTIWTLTDQGMDDTRKRISWNRALNIVIDNSEIETSAANLNFSNRSIFAEKRKIEVFTPTEAFNSDYRIEYATPIPKRNLSNVPREARKAKTESTALTKAEIKQYRVMQLLRPMLEARYTIKDAKFGRE